MQDKATSRRLATAEDVRQFSAKHGLYIPEDLAEYFMKVNGSGASYDKNTFQFFSLEEFIPTDERFLPDYQNCFVIAEHCINLFTFAVYLSVTPLTSNAVYAICGEQYKQVATCFTEFIKLYLKDASLVMF